MSSVNTNIYDDIDDVIMKLSSSPERYNQYENTKDFIREFYKILDILRYYNFYTDNYYYRNTIYCYCCKKYEYKVIEIGKELTNDDYTEQYDYITKLGLTYCSNCYEDEYTPLYYCANKKCKKSYKRLTKNTLFSLNEAFDCEGCYERFCRDCVLTHNQDDIKNDIDCGNFGEVVSWCNPCLKERKKRSKCPTCDAKLC